MSTSPDESGVDLRTSVPPTSPGETCGRTAAPDHPARLAAQAEIHARPISRLLAPARIRRVAFLLDRDPQATPPVRSRMVDWCRANGVEPPEPAARRFSFTSSGFDVTWELHNEFYTYTWIAAATDPASWPAGIGLEAAWQDRVVVAVRLDVRPTHTITATALASFDELSLCYSSVEGGRAEVATDFLVDGNGFTHFELAAGDIGPNLLGSVVRRLLEIETYRVLALVGISLARSVSPILSRLEGRLTEAMQGIGSALSAAESHNALQTMHDLEVAAADTVELTRYRFAASQAYGDILRRRLADLDERPTGEHRTLERYLNHRVDPALATFKAIEQRQASLFEQMARSTALLGTRISLDIENQNRTILETIADTAKSQYRLQATVEGLSTIAISYYILGIIGYALHVFDKSYEDEKTLAVAILAPIIVLVVWLSMKRVHKH